MAGLPLLQQNQEAYASSQQVQGPAPLPTQGQRPPSRVPLPQPPSTIPTPSCNPQSPTLLFGSTGPNVAELQRVITQVGYSSLLAGQGAGDGSSSTASTNSGIDGEFGWHQLQDDLIQIPGIVLLVTIYRIFNKMDGTPVLQ